MGLVEGIPTNFTNEEICELVLSVIPEGTDPKEAINGLLYAAAVVVNNAVDLNKTPEGLFGNIMNCYVGKVRQAYKNAGVIR